MSSLIPGTTEKALRVRDCLDSIESQPERPFDHGVWVPLISAWPEPDFPVYQLSLCPSRGTLWHLEMGRKLAKLREQGVLIIGSGGIVHNLGGINCQAEPGQGYTLGCQIHASHRIRYYQAEL